MLPDPSYAPLRSFILANTDLTTLILAYQGAHRPQLPYATLHLVSEKALSSPGWREYRGKDVTLTEAPAIEREWVWQLDVFGDMPVDIFAQIDAAWRVPQVHYAMQPFKIHETSIVRHLPELIDEGQYEDRANMDITVRGVVAIDFDIDDIGTVTDPTVTRL